MTDNKVGSKIGFFLAGLGVGTVVALLFAPTSGEEAREFIGKKAEEGRHYMTAKSRQFRRQAEGLVDKARDLVA